MSEKRKLSFFHIAHRRNCLERNVLVVNNLFLLGILNSTQKKILRVILDFGSVRKQNLKNPKRITRGFG